MKNKALRIGLLVLGILICLSVALYAAHSLSQAKISKTPSISAAEADYLQASPPVDGATKLLRKAN